MMLVVLALAMPVSALSPVYFEPDPSSATTDDSTWVIIYCDMEPGETLKSGQLHIITDVDDGSGGEGVDHSRFTHISAAKSTEEGFGWESVGGNTSYVDNGHLWVTFCFPLEYDEVIGEWQTPDGGVFGPYTETKKIRLARIRVATDSTLTTPGITPLEFSAEYRPDDCPICQDSDLYMYTGSLPTEMRNGTFFHYADNNLTSCNATGWPKDAFMPNEAVHVLGRGLAASTSYNLWIQNESVEEGDALVGDPSGSQEPVTTDADGDFGPTEIWDDVGAGTPNWYDIVADNGDDTYNAANDFLDAVVGWGFVAPVPELPAVALVSVGLLGLIGAIWRRRYE